MASDVGAHQSMTECDVLVVGGGMVGASLACALARLPLRVMVIDGTPLRSPAQPSYDDRSIALAYGSSRIFSAMGLWESMAPRAAPIRRIHISDRGRFGVARLDAAEQRVDALGYVLETRVLGHVLQERIGAVANVEFLCPAQLIALEVGQDAATARIRTEHGERCVRAALVVGADGAGSSVRQLLGIAVRRWDYGQTAIIANISSEKPHNHVAYERFTDTGPLALLPLHPTDGEPATSGRCSLVWTARDAQVDALLALDEAGFLRALQDRFGYRLGRMIRAGERHAYPLALVRARAHVHARVALIGNAAHTLHPVAGQGFNLGIRDVAVLAELLADAARQGGDVGAAALLQRYAQWRRHDHSVMIAFTDGLARLFSNPLMPVAVARDLGLLAVDLLPPLRQFLARRTMGMAGRLSRLGRGLPLH